MSRSPCAESWLNFARPSVAATSPSRSASYYHVVGGKECEEGQIFIEPQGMCVMAGIGKGSGEAAAAMRSVKERPDTKYGIVLLQPAYTRYHLELSPRLQGERRHLLPQQPLDRLRRGRARPRGPGL